MTSTELKAAALELAAFGARGAAIEWDEREALVRIQEHYGPESTRLYIGSVQNIVWEMVSSEQERTGETAVGPWDAMQTAKIVDACIASWTP